MRIERDLMTGMQVGATAPEGEGVVTRSQGPKSVKAGRLRTLRWSPGPLGASSPPSMGFGSSGMRTAVHARVRSGGCFAVKGVYLASGRMARGATHRSLQGLAPKKRGGKPAEHSRPRAKVRELEAKMAQLEKELATAHTILEVRSRDISNYKTNISIAPIDGKAKGWVVNRRKSRANPRSVAVQTRRS